MKSNKQEMAFNLVSFTNSVELGYSVKERDRMAKYGKENDRLESSLTMMYNEMVADKKFMEKAKNRKYVGFLPGVSLGFTKKGAMKWTIRDEDKWDEKEDEKLECESQEWLDPNPGLKSAFAEFKSMHNARKKKKKEEIIKSKNKVLGVKRESVRTYDTEKVSLQRVFPLENPERGARARFLRKREIKNKKRREARKKKAHTRNEGKKSGERVLSEIKKEEERHKQLVKVKCPRTHEKRHVAVKVLRHEEERNWKYPKQRFIYTHELMADWKKWKEHVTINSLKKAKKYLQWRKKEHLFWKMEYMKFKLRKVLKLNWLDVQWNRYYDSDIYENFAKIEQLEIALFGSKRYLRLRMYEYEQKNCLFILDIPEWDVYNNWILSRVGFLPLKSLIAYTRCIFDRTRGYLKAWEFHPP
jgi:hypothetical protein